MSEGFTSNQSMIDYKAWRARYVRDAGDGGGLLVAYNQDGSSHPPDAVTVSEAEGWALLSVLLLFQWSVSRYIA